MKRVVWKPGDLVNLKLRDDLYTIGQMLMSPYMRFFKIHNDSGDWQNVDLNAVEELFTVAIAGNFLNIRGEGKIKKGVTPAEDMSLSKYWIRSRGNGGGDLVEINPEVGYMGYQDKAVRKDIPADDRETLLKYEMVNLWTQEELTERLILSLEAGRNVDPFMYKLFPEADFLMP